MNYRPVIDIWRVIADPMSGADQDRVPRHRPVTDPLLTPSSSILSRTNDRLPPGMVRHLRTTVQTSKGENGHEAEMVCCYSSGTGCCCFAGSGSSLVRGGVRRRQARNPEGNGDQGRVDESTRPFLYRREGR